MSNYSNTKATIAANVYTNHNNEVTAEMVKAGINAVVDTLIAGGFIYKGVATTSTNPGSPDANVFYIATAPGTYTNFGSLVVADGEVAILKYNGSWSKEVTGAATAAKVSALGHEVGQQFATIFGPEITKTLTWSDGYINSVGTINSSSASKYTQPFLLQKGETLWVGTRNTNICIIGTTNADSLAVGNSVKVIQLTSQVNQFEVYSYTATEDIKIVLCVRWSEYSTLFRAGAKISDAPQDIVELQEDVWRKFSYKNLENTFTAPGYLPLSRTIKAGTYCKVTIDLSAWNVYTNIVAYAAEGGAHETIKGATYTFNGLVEYTPTIDVNYIRIDSSAPGAGASGSILIRSAINYTDRIDFDAFVGEMNAIRYIGGEITFDGNKDYLALGDTLYAGHKYQIDYKSTGYNSQLFYIQLTSAPGGGSGVGTIATGLGGVSDASGRVTLSPTADAKGVRIGVGSGTVPASANTHLSIYEVFDFADKIYVDGRVSGVEQQLINGYSVLAPFFDTEMQDTIDSVNALTNQRCLVMPIVTDTHWRWTTAEGNAVKKRSINNVRYFCERVYADGVSHLGDILDTGVLTTETDDELYDLMQQYLMSLSSSNRHFYAANGNHDGASLGYFNEMKWYGIIGRATANEADVTRYQTTPYFYIDHAPTKVRCIFLSNPDNVTGDTTYWGFSQRELDWLSNDALDVPDGYSVLFFTHIPPVSGYADSAANLASFATLCTNFNANHTGQVLGVICGHDHIDLVIPVGWTYTGGFSNTLPCPIIILGANYYNLGTTDREDKWGGIIYGRNVGTATEDLWTILVYTPDDAVNNMHFVRFGAGEDFDV